MDSNIPIIILAAGSSSRMGQSKQLLPWDKKTVIEQVIINALEANPIELIVVIGAKAIELEKILKKNSVTVIHNSQWKAGMATSIQAGVEYVKQKDYPAALITLADIPTLPSSHYSTLIRVFSSSKAPIIISEFTNTKGVPAIFDRIVFNQLCALAGDQGAKSLLSKFESQAVLFNYLFEDMDTPEAYRELQKKIGTT